MSVIGYLLLAIGGLASAGAVIAACAWCYRVGRRDGLEEKTWLTGLPPVELAEPHLTALDPSDTTDRLILEARMTEAR